MTEHKVHRIIQAEKEIQFHKTEDGLFRIEVGDSAAPMPLYVFGLTSTDAMRLASWLNMRFRYQVIGKAGQ